MLVKVIVVVVVVNATGFTLFLCQSKNAEKKDQLLFAFKNEEICDLFFFERIGTNFLRFCAKLLMSTLNIEEGGGRGHRKKLEYKYLHADKVELADLVQVNIIG